MRVCLVTFIVEMHVPSNYRVSAAIIRPECEFMAKYGEVFKAKPTSITKSYSTLYIGKPEAASYIIKWVQRRILDAFSGRLIGAHEKPKDPLTP